MRRPCAGRVFYNAAHADPSFIPLQAPLPSAGPWRRPGGGRVAVTQAPPARSGRALAWFLRRYLLSCGVLLLPILAWNIALIDRLPPAISTPALWGAIARPLALAENFLRILVFALPFLMPLNLATRQQKRGVAIFVVGTVAYFASWVPLIVAPESAWATSGMGFLAPAYTPALWLLGLALAGRHLVWRSGYQPWMYAALSAVFLAVHIAHATLVYAHNY